MAVLAFIAGGLWPSNAGAGQLPLLTEAFTGSSVTNSHWVAGGTIGPLSTTETTLPCLTASTDTSGTPVPGCPGGQTGISSGGDPSGSGVLRLNDTALLEATFAADHEARPFTTGLSIDFDFFQYANPSIISPPGDGLAFFLADGSVTIATPGAEGGALGYAPTGGISGLPGGYLGIGFDEYGNFEQTLADGTGCTAPAPVALPRPQVGVRGPGTGTAGYCLIGASGVLPGALDSPAATQRTVAGVRRHAHIAVDAPGSASPNVTVSVDFGSGLQQVVQVPLPPAPPATIQFGFSGGTGIFSAVHEVSNLTVTAVTAAPRLTLTKTPLGGFAAGGTGTFQLTAGVASTGGPELQPLTVSDQLPRGLTVAAGLAAPGWNCAATVVGSSTVTCSTAASPSSPLNAGTTLPVITVLVRVAADAAGSLTNTATAASSDAVASVQASATVAITPTTPPTGDAPAAPPGAAVAGMGLLLALAGIGLRRLTRA
jgi:hypothetical protein